MSDLRDFTGKNRVFTGAAGIRPSDDGLGSGDRVDDKGRLRFNDTTDLLEYYTGTAWKSIDSPPLVTQFTVNGGSDVTSAVIDVTDSSNVTIEVKGSLFDTTGGTIAFEGTSETLSPASITRNSANLFTVVISAQLFDNTNSPYAIKVTNGSGLSATLADAITADRAVSFTNSADTNFNIFDGARSSLTIAAADLAGATDPDGDTITYSITSGSLPSGLSIASSTGVITGSVDAVGSDTVSTFTVQAATTNSTATRQFTITVKAPVVNTFTSSSNLAVPTGITAVDVLVVAGGGAGGDGHSGGGGAGGLIYRPGFPVSPGTTIPVTVGAGDTSPNSSNDGQDSVFSNLTAKGGGGGFSNSDGRAGGSGAGGSCYRSDGQQDGGPGTQPGQPGESGNYGFGNSGGNGSYDGDPNHGAQGGSGGGAGGTGAQSGKRANAPAGGVGKAYSISGSSVHYAGGGGNGCHQNVGQSGAGGTGGGGGSIPDGGSANSPNAPGTANRGGGGGGGSDGQGGQGGSGVVIVSY